MSKFYDRKQPDHGIHETNNGPTIVFVTVCTKDRRSWLACQECHALLRAVLQEAQAWYVGRYVVMPDHVHFFAAPGDRDISLEKWCQYWKSLFTKRVALDEFAWQRSHWDTRVRDERHYGERWEYMRGNPVEKGLADNADDWPYQGEILELRW